jgi:hypothetical protein
MISRFTADALRHLEGKRIMKDYEVANRILDERQAALGP